MPTPRSRTHGAANQGGYQPALAEIHDQGYGQVARAAAGVLLAELARRRLGFGGVLDLGCGSGILAEQVQAQGYQVAGYDLSPAMLEIARRRVPGARFELASVWHATWPGAVGVAAIGEVFNYCFDGTPRAERMVALLRRIYRALEPGGVLLFDVAGPGRAPTGTPARGATVTDNWACLAQAVEDDARRILTRSITSFVRTGNYYRRFDEVHRLRLWKPSDVAAALRQAGFRARRLASYGDFQFPQGWAGFLAVRPR